MYRKKQIFLTSLVILMCVLMPLNVMAAKSKIIPNDETGIPDRVLYQTILREVGKSKNFTEKDAEKIKRLDASKDKIKNKIKTLKGIGKLKNLTKLDVSSNNIKSLSGIENLFNLTSLYADHNQITNINPIKNLFNIRYVSLNYNKISSLKSIEKLTQLESLDVQINKIKKIPDLNRYTSLSEIGLKYNKISEEELNKKIPRHWRRNSIWYKSTVKLQNLVKTITLVKPTSFSVINKNTKKISGIANKNSTISLRDPKGKKIVSVKTDRKGKFTFRNLNLKKWAGMTLSLQSFVVDQLYGEKNILKEVKFTVR
ncbi:MAG: hypothetical protein RHS_3431 [Robinsoniella sp. RHS]|nr:leucine-rich repeat domain-containing protein [Robinsoniella peoriensis]KLU70754.1 MAG: hypothetical protein RHS_3431 [Robinsoniella sp. RHS]MBS6212231.1 leucine-rich repeat domain-containing protein [Proteus hauseri]